MAARDTMNKILEHIENGLLDKDDLILACLKYMSEDDVRDMAHANDIPLEDEEEEDDSDPNGDWYDTSKELQ